VNRPRRTSEDFRRRESSARAAALLFCGALACLCAIIPARGQTTSAKGDAGLGERIYREGLLPSGARLRATVQGDVAVEGEQFNCAACHRRSGFGSTEGAAFVPAVTGSALFGQRSSPRADLFRRLFQEVQPQRFRARVRDPRVRPAYTDETLALALREGRDASGRDLDPLMPRYQLSDEDMGHLVAYLKSLSAAPAPGVTPSEIHFAVVAAEGAGHEKRRAMLDVMEAYFRRKNADTLGLLRRPGHSAFYDEESYAPLREWVLHVWELKGTEETWGRQLEAFYRERPVFALLGGVAFGDWRPVHDFCEREEVPCLFPSTDLPVVEPPGAYTVYFSKGLTVEAEALARHLREQAKPGRPERVLQVFRAESRGLVPATALREALPGEGAEAPRERVIPRARKLTRDFWERLLEEERPSVLVLWLDDADLMTLNSARATTTGALRQVYLSSSLLLSERQPLEGLRERVYLTYPYALPQGAGPHLYRARAWLRSRGIGGAHERVRLNTYFALLVADYSLMRLAGNFQRDYFVESVEHETESTTNPGVFPRLSLGPGQRFASKGSYIVRPTAGERGGVEPASEWIIP
jgi:mono/diheme cytochrome c family protein